MDEWDNRIGHSIVLHCIVLQFVYIVLLRFARESLPKAYEAEASCNPVVIDSATYRLKIDSPLSTM